jgi:hypothetical protein
METQEDAPRKQKRGRSWSFMILYDSVLILIVAALFYSGRRV